MLKFLRKLHFIYFSVIIIFFFAVFWPFYYVFSRNPRTYGILNIARKIQSYIVTILAGVFFNFHYEQKLEKGKTYIYCSNHTSTVDIILFCILAKGRFHFMGKEELANNPILKVFFKTIDIAVARTSKISAFRAFKKAGENLQKGMSLIIFPEGGIIEGVYPPVLNNFKAGPFRLAIENNIEIVPVSIKNMWQILWDDGTKLGSRPGIVDVYVHKPIATSILAAENDEDLKQRVFDIINSKL